MFRSWISALLVVCPLASFGQGVFTVNIGSPSGGSGATTPLVRHGDDWRYRFGTNAPEPDWKTNSNTSLDSTWLTGPGGFGYEDGDDATVLNVMSNRFSTLYIRREFAIANTPGTNEQLRLIMDWDDGFVAWLDGTEVARSSNAPGVVGTEPAYDATSLQGQNHEASAGGGAAPTTYNLGRAVDRLAPGTHVLAVMGLNSATNSGDFSLIADLEMRDTSATGGATTNQHITIVQSTPVALSGSNTLAGAARVTVNGVEAAFSMAEGTWRLSQPLRPGMNRLFIAALDGTGNILASVNRDVVFEPSTVLAGGMVGADTSWSSVLRVTNSVTIPADVTLTIEPGAVLLLSGGVSITATGVVNVIGTEVDPVFVFPAGNAAWGNFGANGSNSFAAFRHMESAGGQLRVVNGGTLLVEDSVVRDLPESGREIIAGVNGGGLIVRRSHVARFTEVDARETPVLIEDSLLEEFLIDGVDIKATNAPLVVRQSTLRYGSPTNSNADAVDFGPGAGAVERCLIHDFRDKGVSIGGAPGTRVSGSVIYKCGIGISAYSSTNLVLVNNTISACDNGIFFRDNPQPAVGTATNLIVWANLNNVVLSNSSMLSLTYSDVGGTAPPGPGNVNVDPQFVNADLHDYRLASTSPVRGAGFGGADMGAVFPIGGIPATPAMLAAHPDVPGSVRLSWLEDSDNEDAFLVERSLDGETWSRAGTAPANSLGFTDGGLSDGFYFYRVATRNSVGKSRYSNIASARPAAAPVTETFVGGQLTESTTWNPAMGIIYVRSNIIVPTNMVLTLAEGTIVRITNGASIRAVAGGAINVLGSESNKVVLSRWNTNAVWGELSANGTNASLYVRHADISGGQTTVYNAAVGLLEDSHFHNYRISGTTLTQPIVLSQFARLMTMRRCHIQTYYETLFRNGVIIVEDCLFEDISGDGLDFDAAQTGTVLRRCTFRNGTLGNVDAVDVGPAELGGSRDVIIEDCLMYNFPFDKGVSVGDSPSQATGTIVRNCLIYGCLSGVMAKDSCIVTVYNCTIVENSWGFTNYNKANPGAATGGGHTIAWNNILWNNRTTLSLSNAGTLTAWYNDFGNTNWPGEGNINVDPLFLDPVARDYRLTSASPCIGAGSNGVTMGVTFPVGGLPTEPVSLVILTNDGTRVLLAWNDTSGNERGFIIEASTNLVDWTVVASAPKDAFEAHASVSSGLHFRVKATNFIGSSFASNVASGTTGDTDGDGMPDAWENTYGLDAGDPDDAGEDADSDGQSNLTEFLSGTDPRDAGSRFGITSIASVAVDSVRLSFTAQAGKAYAIQFRDSLTSGVWQDLIDVPAESSARLYTFTDSLPPGTRTRFYRLIIP